MGNAAPGGPAPFLAQVRSGITIRRTAGADRFQTSAFVAGTSFTTPPPLTISVATGATWPDGIAAGELSGVTQGGAPVLLADPVNGFQADEVGYIRAIAAMVPGEIGRLLGGTAALPASVQSQFESYFPHT
jgi:hypothetical protein